jgi:hypothetical protein
MSHQLKQAIRKAYNASPRSKVDRLMAEQSRWQRKLTIAANKLALVRRKMDKALLELTEPDKE